MITALIRKLASPCLAQCTVAIAALGMFIEPCGAKPSAPLSEFPVKTIRIIVAASPGTADDYFARSVAAELKMAYQQRVIVDNRPGAGGLIGNRLVSKAGPDGHTLGMVSVTRLVTELLHDQSPYHALADIVGVAHVASITNVLVVTPAILVRTAPEFVAYARALPGELNFASLGTGSASHLASEVFSRALRIHAVHVPFRNMADSYGEMTLGRVHYAIYTLPSVLGAVREQRLRALAVMTPQRSAMLPAVPAIGEFGLPEAQIDSWSGIVAPRDTPRRIVEQLHGDIVRGLRKAQLRQQFLNQGAESTPESTPDGFMRLMQEEYARYQTLIRVAGIKVE